MDFLCPPFATLPPVIWCFSGSSSFYLLCSINTRMSYRLLPHNSSIYFILFLIIIINLVALQKIIDLCLLTLSYLNVVSSRATMVPSPAGRRAGKLPRYLPSRGREGTIVHREDTRLGGSILQYLMLRKGSFRPSSVCMYGKAGFENSCPRFPPNSRELCLNLLVVNSSFSTVTTTSFPLFRKLNMVVSHQKSR